MMYFVLMSQLNVEKSAAEATSSFSKLAVTFFTRTLESLKTTTKCGDTNAAVSFTLAAV